MDAGIPSIGTFLAPRAFTAKQSTYVLHSRRRMGLSHPLPRLPRLLAVRSGVEAYPQQQAGRRTGRRKVLCHLDLRQRKREEPAALVPGQYMCTSTALTCCTKHRRPFDSTQEEHQKASNPTAKFSRESLSLLPRTCMRPGDCGQ